MLRNLKELYDYVLQAKDGEIGRCNDFLFDDLFWTIRYMVADTGKWLPRQKVLVSPISLGEPDSLSRLFQVRLTKEQIEHCPPLDSDAPVSRQYETKWFDFYGYPYYWLGAGPWGAEPLPSYLFLRKKEDTKVAADTGEGDPRLRSTREVKGYHIEASDGEIGHVEDFIVDDESWRVRYMVIDTRNWLPGRKVLVAPTWIDSVSWGKGKVRVNMTRQAIKDSPKYDPSAPVNREYELRLYDFHGQPKYWE